MTISFNSGSNTSSCNCSGVVSFVINNAGHLIVTYDDNTIDDLGLVIGHDGTDGTNFYPNEIGFAIPDGTFEIEKPLGWVYLSLTNPVSLYFKTNVANTTPATWTSSEFGKGQTGDQGRGFTIDSSGTVLPTTGLFDNYTFFNTTNGSIYMYHLSTTSWVGPYQFKGDQGLQGRFIIDLQDDVFPTITNLNAGYTLYNTNNGFLYYVVVDGSGNKSWSQGIQFRGPQGLKGNNGDTGPAGSDANNIYAIKNVIDTSFENALLVIGILPAGYLVTNIEINVITAYDTPVTDLDVRVGGTAQSEIGSTIIAPVDYFDINVARKYIVNEVNHDISVNPEIISCVFNESVNNSLTGNMTIIVTIAKQLPITPIEDNI